MPPHTASTNMPARNGAVELRPLGIEEADAMFRSAHDPELQRLTGTHADHTLEAVRAYCERVAKDPSRWDFAIVVEGSAIGEVVLNNHDTDNEVISFRIALWDLQACDKGYGTMATRAAIAFAFERDDINRIELEVYDFNPRAIAVYRKCGFRHEGTRRQALLWNGERIDAHIMGLLKQDSRAPAG